MLVLALLAPARERLRPFRWLPWTRLLQHARARARLSPRPPLCPPSRPKRSPPPPPPPPPRGRAVGASGAELLFGLCCRNFPCLGGFSKLRFQSRGSSLSFGRNGVALGRGFGRHCGGGPSLRGLGGGGGGPPLRFLFRLPRGSRSFRRLICPAGGVGSRLRRRGGGGPGLCRGERFGFRGPARLRGLALSRGGPLLCLSDLFGEEQGRSRGDRGPRGAHGGDGEVCCSGRGRRRGG